MLLSALLDPAALLLRMEEAVTAHITTSTRRPCISWVSMVVTVISFLLVLKTDNLRSRRQYSTTEMAPCGVWIGTFSVDLHRITPFACFSESALFFFKRSKLNLIASFCLYHLVATCCCDGGGCMIGAWVRMARSMWACTCVSMYMKVRVWHSLDVFLNHSPLCILRQSLAEAELIDLPSWLARESWRSVCLWLPGTEITDVVP